MSKMGKLKKGIVLETRQGEITVLTPQGEFQAVPWAQLPYPEVGSELEYCEQERPVSLWSGILARKRMLAMVACLLLVVFSVSVWTGTLLFYDQKIVAYVNVDINPSIELGLNKKGQVVQAVGLNRDGEQLLQKLNLLDLSAEKAIELITRAAIEQKYLQAGKENNVIITVSETKKAKAPQEPKKLEETVTKQLSAQEINVNTQVIEVDKELHEKAKELGVSPGKYVIFLEALDQGLDVSLEDLKDSSITKAITEAGGVPAEILAKAQLNKAEIKELEERIKDKLKDIIKEYDRRDDNEDKDREAETEEQTGEQKENELNPEDDNRRDEEREDHNLRNRDKDNVPEDEAGNDEHKADENNNSGDKIDDNSGENNGRGRSRDKDRDDDQEVKDDNDSSDNGTQNKSKEDNVNNEKARDEESQDADNDTATEPEEDSLPTEEKEQGADTGERNLSSRDGGSKKIRDNIKKWREKLFRFLWEKRK